MDTQNWYQSLIKPQWAPAPSIFGIVWPILYAIIAVTFGAAGYMFWKGRISFLVLLPFILNIIFNLAFTPIQFRLQNNLLAAVDILLVLGTLIWAMMAIWPHAKWIALANIPYLLWILFATALQLTITYLNWK
ncbi:MAG: TspO protein [Candidatus Moranbacteria bacterium RIFOXYB1_FULL_43_19]|nr:MAG: TspO protein [Candidatus Moranbacteria bacterium RIFOXYA1_FULL_44_7]OGI27335.1 MAG: TspO protein [Candidatus Moranbacteria bacterium RIFOXYB1_FULL_43_19]OGI33839.1 MAG: TspO protein [Candidatus Moranbacteria bacterium RIFOXYC1_FULL_44_13]OGI38786.1 MAG: TspO protein [Candidatus Moranbacteria bacterium RIFOXYD1_FULL_44_12]